MSDFGLECLRNIVERVKAMSAQEYEELLEKARHVRGVNGEPSYHDMVERGYFDYVHKLHDVYIDAVYVHYKENKEYRVIEIAMDCETLELVVIYEALYKNPKFRRWARKLSSFLETLPDGTPRFRLKNEQDVIMANRGAFGGDEE